MNCDTCAKQDGCSFSGKIGGQGCRAWEGIPAVPACPLPKIGSKAWGWVLNRDRYTGSKWWASPKVDYQISYIRRKPVVVARDATIIARPVLAKEGRRIAELLTRLDWRRKMRGKK